MGKKPVLIFILASSFLAFGQRTIAPGNVTRLPAKANRWAVLIGVDAYDDPNITKLQGAANDVKALKQTLVSYAGFPDDQVIVLATGEAGNRRPTRANMLTRLSNVVKMVPKGGLLVFGFSGHGIDRNGRAFLLPSDSQLTDDVRLLEQTSISVNSVQSWIRESSASQVIVLLDACRNDPGGRADAANPLTASYDFNLRNANISAFATFFATNMGQRAWESSDEKRGYFMWMLERALKGEAANEKGEVTLLSALRFVQERVPKQVAIDLGPSRQQQPMYRLEGFKPEELVLSVTPRLAQVSAAVVVNEEDVYWRQCETNKGAFCQAYLEQFPAGRFARLAKMMIAEAAKMEPKVGDFRLNPKDGLRYQYIPPGKFSMGCSPGDKDCLSDERSVQVTISKGFWLGETEVTQSAYARVTGLKPSMFDSPDRPVEEVIWSEANNFCSKAGGRLPTEAEWEYAARGGTTTSLYGNLDDIAWYEKNANKTTHAVKTKRPNAYGLYDMFGNVDEWVADYYGAAIAGGKDPQGPATGPDRGARGRSWYDEGKSLRASYRGFHAPSFRNYTVGFRCAMD